MAGRPTRLRRWKAHSCRGRRMVDAHKRLPMEVFMREALGEVVDTVPGATIKPEWVRYVEERPD